MPRRFNPLKSYTDLSNDTENNNGTIIETTKTTTQSTQKIEFSEDMIIYRENDFPSTIYRTTDDNQVVVTREDAGVIRIVGRLPRGSIIGNIAGMQLPVTYKSISNHCVLEIVNGDEFVTKESKQISFIQTIPGFANIHFTPELIKTTLNLFTMKEMNVGEKLIEAESDDVNSIYFFISGTANVINSQGIIVSTVLPFGMTGEGAFIETTAKRMANIVITSKSEILGINVRELKNSINPIAYTSIRNYILERYNQIMFINKSHEGIMNFLIPNTKVVLQN